MEPNLASILNQINDCVQKTVPGVKALAVDIFVDHATFEKLREANRAAFSLTEDEPALTIRLGDVEVIIMEAGEEE